MPADTMQTDSPNVCARRVLQSAWGPVEVVMEVPVADADDGDFRCAYRINGPRTQRRSHAMGIDAFQAIELAMQKIGTDLFFSEEGQHGELRWLDAPYEIGFPLPESTRDIAPGRNGG